MNGKVALVTGAGSSGPGVGTGRAISVLFAREGARVLLMDSNAAAAAETQRLIHEEGGEAAVFTGDVSRSADCKAAVDAAVARFGRLDTLVNNVAVTSAGDITQIDEADIDRLLSVNLKSVLLMTKHAVPAIAAAGGGSITNIGSVSALRHTAGQSIYTASKGGVVSLTSMWAVELGRRHIRVNCVCPGTLYTPIAVGLFGMPENVRWHRTNLPPLATEGTAWDVGYATLFLASDEARWISGATIPVDGGFISATPQWGADVEAARQS
jgi:NAD(P)-dependent dehydrogenase (short-subunit alcohol dehydrogenase family)